MKTVFALALSLAAFTTAAQACELTAAGKAQYKGIHLAECAEEISAFCIYATSQDGRVIRDRQRPEACSPDGSSCTLKGDEFGLALYDTSKPEFANGPFTTTYQVRSLRSKAVLATCK